MPYRIWQRLKEQDCSDEDIEETIDVLQDDARRDDIDRRLEQREPLTQE